MIGEHLLLNLGEDNADLLLETLIEYSVSNKTLCGLWSDFLLATLREELLKEILYFVSIQYMIFFFFKKKLFKIVYEHLSSSSSLSKSFFIVREC